MSFAYVNSASYHNLLLREKDQHIRWVTEPAKASKVLHDLEEEIRVLRMKMEQMYMEEPCFNNSSILAISRLLDEKINQYLELIKDESR
ncbi:aspartyl-phosphate phosphatase Spo0E family protein [Paenibacillus sp. J2TS4]|uniref:aspartyl-phosphate phosphatase Spo0E family protein n=1 Tax=Paenibacillus sp. J2TS4 TaxID=2807194 RepID=UPI001AFFD2B4|nr:aspartyl-phosphate phosphatase Spo0E family protein [Paenibacillus sp. J2TS4]GIP34372.1 hypothetical protein J2TS4_35820 [Paenibacillus sp. J2TS4]